MKLLERNQMHETRFSQSFSEFNGTRYKPLNSTRNSFTSRNSHSHKLPQLSRSFSSSTAKSTTKKLFDMDEKVQDLSKKVHDLKLQTRVKINNILGNKKVWKFLTGRFRREIVN